MENLELFVKFVNATTGGGSEGGSSAGQPLGASAQTGDLLMILLSVLAGIVILGSLFLLYKYNKLKVKNIRVFVSVLCVVGAVGFSSSVAMANTNQPFVPSSNEITATVDNSNINFDKISITNTDQNSK